MSDLERALARLRAPGSEPLRHLTTLSVDVLLAQRLDALVDTDTAAELACDALHEPLVRRVLEAHVRPALERQRARVADTGERLGDAFPPGADETLIALLRQARMPDVAWADGLLDARLLKRLLAPVLQEALLSFARRLPLPHVGPGASAVAGRAGALGSVLLGGIAARAAEVGRNVASGIASGVGAEVERKVHAAAREFAEDALDGLRATLHERLESEEGRALVQSLVAHAVRHLHRTRTDALLGGLDALPAEDTDALVARIVAHGAAREAIRAAVRDEVRAALAIEGSRTVRDLAREAGIEASLARALETPAAAVLGPLTASPEFGAWLAALLA